MRAAGGHTKIFAALLLVATLSPIGSAPIAGSDDGLAKLDRRLRQRAHLSTGHSRVIVRAAAGMSVAGIAPIIQQAGATLGRRLPNIGSHVAVVPNALLRRLAASLFVALRLARSTRRRHDGAHQRDDRRDRSCGRSSATTGRASASPSSTRA